MSYNYFFKYFVFKCMKEKKPHMYYIIYPLLSTGNENINVLVNLFTDTS